MSISYLCTSVILMKTLLLVVNCCCTSTYRSFPHCHLYRLPTPATGNYKPLTTNYELPTTNRLSFPKIRL